MTRLELALVDVAHETLLRHFERIFTADIELPFQMPKTRARAQRRPGRQRLTTLLKHSGTINLTPSTEADDHFLDQLSTTEHKVSFQYKQALKNGKVSVTVLADQLLLGGVVPTNSFYYVKVAFKCLVNAIGVALMASAAVLPALQRQDKHAPQSFGDFVVIISFILFVFGNGSMMALWYPTQLRNLFSQLSNSFRMFNVMLMGGNAAGVNFLPHVRVGNFDDIAGWYLLYSFFIASMERRKLALEVGFGHGVLTVVGMSVLLLLHVMQHGNNPDWTPGVEFGETILFVLAFAIFSLPPLVVGLQANLFNRKTVDLLWGHATESRAYLHGLEKELQGTKDRSRQQELKREIKDATAAIELTESIAQRARLDTALVVRTLGMELTFGQFTAIASLCSTAGVYAYNKLDQTLLLQAFY